METNTSLKGSRRSVLDKRQKSIERRFIFAVCYTFFLPATLLERSFRFLTGSRTKGNQSILQEAHDSASMCTRYAFMG